MQIPVSQLIVKYMERLGIEAIFGMPGAHILPVYDALYDSPIQSILAKHEQGAAFMAGGFNRTSGKIGACITTAGPGATNLVTGIANAYADKQPVLAITGEAPTYIFGKGGLQESSGEGGSIDQSALFKGITRYNRIIERTDYLPNILNQAAKILLSPNSGPVLLSIPYNVQKEMVDDSILDQIKTDNGYHKSLQSSQPIEDVSQLIIDAKHPVIIAGYGSIKSGAQEQIKELSQSLNIPVTSTLKGKGTISEQSELSLGCLGVTSRGYAYEYIVEHADLIIFLGAGFNERTSYVWKKELLENKRVIQIDHNPEQLEKVFKADICVEGDIKAVLSLLLHNLKNKHATAMALDLEQDYNIPAEKKTHEDNSPVFQSGFDLVEKFFKVFEAHFAEDIIVFDDNIIFAQNFLNISSSSRYYPNSGVSSLGHAIPAAIGARLSTDKPTFALIGDGGFQMCCMEIMTAVNYQLPLTIFMFNNATMGLIRKNQHQQYDQRFIDCDFTNPDYEQLAKSFGIEYQHVACEQDLDTLAEQFAQSDYTQRINLVEIMIDKDTFPGYHSRR